MEHIEHLKKAGSKGGKTTFQRHGREHFSRIGKIGGSKPKKKRGESK